MSRTLILSVLSLLLVLLGVAEAGAQDPERRGRGDRRRGGPPRQERQDPAGEEAAEESGEAEAQEEEVEEVVEGEPEPSPYLAITGGDVYTVTQGVLHGATVLCKNDRILAVGSDVRVPEGANVLDASGMHVYPGLVAVRSSGIVGGGGFGRGRGRGRGGGGGAGEDVIDSFDPYALNLDLGLSGGLTTVEANGAVVKLARGTLDGVFVDYAPWVTMNYSTSSPSNRAKVRRELDAVREYLRLHRRWELDDKAGVKGEDGESLPEPETKGLNQDYLALLRREKTARFNSNALKDLLNICDLLERYPMDAVVFGGQEAWACAARLGRSGARLVVTPRSKRWADENRNAPSGWSIENAAKLYNAGVELAILPGSVFISTGGTAGRDLLTLPMEAAFAIRGGLPQEAALRAVTLDAAKVLGIEDRVGSIEAGKDADLIVTDGDLFDYRTFVQWSYVNGRLVYDKQKMPYFQHIRPREEPSAEEVMDALREAVGASAAAEE